MGLTPYPEILIAVVTLRVMYTAAQAEERSVWLWLLVALLWLVGARWLLEWLLGGFVTALVALVGSYSTMFAANLLDPDGLR